MATLPSKHDPDYPVSALFLDLNSYFASVEQQRQPALRGKPIIVVPTLSDSTCAIAASYPAKAYGIKTGTKVYEAKRLCPGLHIVHADHQHYVAYHHKILEVVEQHIPIDKVHSIDEVACQLMGRQRRLDQAVPLAQAIKTSLAREVGACLTCSIGLAPNVFLAKVASDMQKPDGLTILTHATLQEKLCALHPKDLPGIGVNMYRRLCRGGLTTMADLWQADPKHLRKLTGSVWGERLWYLLRGHTLPDAPTQRRTLGHSHVLDPAYRPLDKAYLVARRLTFKAGSRLRRLGYYTEKLILSVRVENGPRLEAEVPLPLCCDHATLGQALGQAWTALFTHQRPARLKKVSVTLVRLQEKRDQTRLANVIEPEARQEKRDKAERLSLALDHLNQRYGRDTILPADLLAQAQTRALSRDTGTKIAFTRIPDAAEFRE